MKVVSNSGPLIALGKLGLTGLLHDLYGNVLIPSAVFDEAVSRGLKRGEPDAFLTQLAVARGGVIVISLREAELPDEFQQLKLDTGERQAIFLAHREQADWLFIDERRARALARAWRLKIKGTLGILVEAFRKDLLSKSELMAIFRALNERNDIWIDRTLLKRIESEIQATLPKT